MECKAGGAEERTARRHEDGAYRKIRRPPTTINKWVENFFRQY